MTIPVIIVSEFSQCAVELAKWYIRVRAATGKPDDRDVDAKVREFCLFFTILLPANEVMREQYLNTISSDLWWTSSDESYSDIALKIEPHLKAMHEYAELWGAEDTAEELEGWLSESLDWLLTQLRLILGPVFTRIELILAGIGGALNTYFNMEDGVIITAIRSVFNDIMGMFDLETGFIGRKIAGTLDAVINLGSDIGDVIDGILNIPSYLRAAANSFLKTILDNLELIFDAIVAGVRSALGAAYDWVVTQLKKVIAYVVEGFMSIISKARAGLDFLIITATTFINGRLDSVFNWLSTTYDRFKNAAIELLEEIYASMLAVFKLAIEELIAIPAELNLDIFNLIGGFTDIFDEFKAWLEDFLSIDTDTISGLVTQLVPLVDKPQKVATT